MAALQWVNAEGWRPAAGREWRGVGGLPALAQQRCSASAAFSIAAARCHEAVGLQRGRGSARQRFEGGAAARRRRQSRRPPTLTAVLPLQGLAIACHALPSSCIHARASTAGV